MNRGGSPLVLSAEDKARMARVDELERRGPGGATELIRMLADSSWAVRRAVVGALATAGSTAVALLLEVLRARRDDETLLAAAVDALVASRAQDVEEQVLQLLADPRPTLQADGAQVLGRRKSQAAVPALEKLTRAPDDNVAVAAIEALGRIGGGAGLPSLVALLRGDNFFRVFPALGVLGRSEDPRAVLPLIDLLPHPFYGTEAAAALGRLGDPGAIRPLARVLAKATDAMARTAALALAEIRQKTQALFGSADLVAHEVSAAVDPLPVIERLAQGASGAAPDEQAALCEVIGWMRHPAAAEALVQLLETSPAAAAAALAQLGDEAAPQLEHALRTGDSARRLALLPLMAAKASPSAAVLECLDDPDPGVRVLACNALGRIGDPAAVPRLFELLEDPMPATPLVTQAAVGAIQSLGSRTTEELALQAARSPDPAVRRAAVRIIAYFGYSAGLDALLAAIAGSEERLREAAIHGLPFVDDPRALEALLSVSESPAPRIRAAAQRALGKVSGSPRVLERLRRGLQDRDPWVRYYACQSLGVLKSEADAPAILELLHDPAGQVRVSAVEALSRFATPDSFDGLRQAAASTDADVQRAALVGLGLQKRPEAFPLLAAAARSAEAATRLIALSALAGYSSAQAVPVLAAAAAEPDENVRAAAIGFLAARPEPAATATLIGLLAAPHARERAVEALASQGDRTLPSVAAALPSAAREVAAALVAVLARTGSHRAISSLAEALGLRNNVDARRAAAAALALVRSTEALDALDRGSRDDDPEVRRLCLSALAR